MGINRILTYVWLWYHQTIERQHFMSKHYENYVADATLSQGYTEDKSQKQNKLELNIFLS